jgi:hypothetical protein
MLAFKNEKDSEFPDFENKSNYEFSAFVDYELSKVSEDLSIDDFRKIVDEFWKINTFAEKIAVMYAQQKKKVMFIVPVTTSVDYLLEIGFLLGVHKQVIKANGMLDILSVRTGVDNYDGSLHYFFPR